MSACPVTVASNDSRAAPKQRNSAWTPSRAAIWFAMSTVTPAGADGVPCTRTGLPRLSAARRVPVGVRSVTTPGVAFRMSPR